MVGAMIGMDAQTGQSLGGVAHVRQSIRDILTTRVGTRVMRREYGSRLYELVDAPIGPETIAAVRMATVEAIARWEPRVSVDLVQVEAAETGRLSLYLEGTILGTGEQVIVAGVQP